MAVFILLEEFYRTIERVMICYMILCARFLIYEAADLFRQA